ncbi:MAG TPA: DUF4238 domain-containing protein [Propylenella sp.]
MNAPWRHHFIAQMQVAWFADPSGLLFYFDKREPKKGIRHQGPRGIFHEEHFYSAVDYDTGEKDVALELYLGRVVEHKAAPVIKKIVTAARAGKTPQLTAQERADWNALVYYQMKRVPDFINRYAADLEAGYERGIIEVEEGYRPLTESERAIVADPVTRERIIRNVRVGAQASFSQMVAAKQASIGMVIVRITDPKKAFIIGSKPVVQMKAPGFTELAPEKAELWLPIASDVAVAPGGQRGSEVLLTAHDHRLIRRLNQLSAAQSSIIAGCSKKLIASLISPR